MGVALGLLLLSQASAYEWALGARVVWLLGYRVAFVCVMTSIALVAPPDFRSTAMGILGAMASLASVIGAPFGTIIAEPYGWRGGIIGFAVMALVGAAIFWFGYNPRAIKRREFVSRTWSINANQKCIPHASSLEHGSVGADQHGRLQCDVLRAIGGEDDLPAWRNGERVCDQHQLHRRHFHQRSIRIPVRQV